jgi:hypothetical protein
VIFMEKPAGSSDQALPRGNQNIRDCAGVPKCVLSHFS